MLLFLSQSVMYIEWAAGTRCFVLRLVTFLAHTEEQSPQNMYITDQCNTAGFKAWFNPIISE